MSAGQPQRVAAVLLGQPRVVVANGGDGTGLHRSESFAAGEHCRAGMRLNHGPQRLLEQIAEFAASPFAVVDLGESVVDDGLHTERVGERLNRAPTPQLR